MKTFEDKLPPCCSLDIGYFERRGSAKRWIEDQDDLDAMYRAFSPGDEITLWTHGRSQEEALNKAGKKRKRDDGQDPLSKRADKENWIDMVFQQLKELHGEQFSGPQLRLWARMNVNCQHESLDSPPRIPIFSGVTPTKTVMSNSLNESAATAVVSMLKTTPESPQQSSSPMSPAKRAHVSGAYLEHLDKLKKLLESGGRV